MNARIESVKTAAKPTPKRTSKDPLATGQLAGRALLNWESTALQNGWEPPQQIAVRQQTELTYKRTREVVRQALNARPRETTEDAARRVDKEVLDQRNLLRDALAALDEETDFQVDPEGEHVELRNRIRALVTK